MWSTAKRLAVNSGRQCNCSMVSTLVASSQFTAAVLATQTALARAAPCPIATVVVASPSYSVTRHLQVQQRVLAVGWRPPWRLGSLTCGETSATCAHLPRQRRCSPAVELPCLQHLASPT